MRFSNFIAMILCSVFVSISESLAQNQVDGKVVDTEGKPLSFVSVCFMAEEDSSFQTGCVTDSLGVYGVQLRSGEYKIKYSCLGYEPSWCVVNVDKSVRIHDVALKPSEVSLDGVNVVASRSPFKLQGHSLWVDVESDPLLSRQDNVYDLLGKVPGCFRIGQSLNVVGKGQPVYYMNGRKVRDQSLVDNLQVDQIKSVKVVAVADARYESSGAPVVDIITKKMGDGLAFNIIGNLEKGKHLNQHYGFASTYNVGNLDLFCGYNYRDSKSQTTNRYNRYVVADTLWNKLQSYESLARLHKHSFHAGMAYRLTRESEIGIQYSGNYNFGRESVVDSTRVSPSVGEGALLFSDTKSRSRSNDHHVNLYYDANMKHQWHLSMVADYIHKESKNNSQILETETSTDNLIYDSWSRWNVFSANVHVRHDFKKWGSLNFGYDFSHSQGVDGIDYLRSQRNGETKNRELKNSVFFGYELSLGEFTFNANARYENLFSKRKIGGQDNFTRNTENNVLPSLSISHFHGMLMQNLDYSVETTRPNYLEINNNVEYKNRYEQTKGNADIRSSVSHSLSYMLMYKWLYFMASYTYTVRPMMPVVYALPERSSVTVSTLKNYSDQQVVAFTLSLRKTFGLWSTSLSGNVQKSFLSYQGLYGEVLKDKQPVALLFFDNDFRLPHDFLLSCSFQQTFSGYLNSLYIKPSSVFNMSLKKGFMNDRLRLSLDAYDIFNGNINRASRRCNNVSVDYETKYETRKFALTLTYRFRKNKEKKRMSSAQTEMQRLQMNEEE